MVAIGPIYVKYCFKYDKSGRKLRTMYTWPTSVQRNPLLGLIYTDEIRLLENYVSYHTCYYILGFEAMVVLRICTCITTILLYIAIGRIAIVTCREPSNITRAVNATNVFIPCPYEFQSAPPIWRINNIDYTSSTLPSIFSLDPGGIFISVIHPCLDGYGFQCIDISGPGLVGRRSQTGFLTVIPQGLCLDEVLELFMQNVIQSNDSIIELNHKELKYGSANTTLAWKVFTNISNCNTSRIISHPSCHPNNVFMDNTTGYTEIVVQAHDQISGILLDFDISSLDLSDLRSQCPKLPDAVRLNATATKALNLLLGKNNCTSINIECDGALHIAISNPNPRKRDIICPVIPEEGTVCFSIEDCAFFVPNSPTFSVCEASPGSSVYTVRFEDNHVQLNNTRVDFYESSNTPVLCELGQLPPTRIYFDSYAINAVPGTARVSVNPNSGTACFFSSVENCMFTDLTQYDISVTDVTGNVIYTNTNISESNCTTIEELTQPQCAPYFLSVHPFTFDDYIIYDSFTQEVTHDATNKDLCHCITQNVQFELVQDQNNSEIEFSCYSQYISLTDIALSFGSENHRKKCANGSIPLTMDIYASCGGSTSTVDVCGYLVHPNGTLLFECPLSTCAQISCPTSPSSDPTKAPNNTTEIVLGVVISFLIVAIIVTVTVIVVVFLIRRYRHPHNTVQPPPHDQDDL